MLAKPVAAFRYPEQAQTASRLVEASFQLWRASWRPCFGSALLYALAGLLPMLTLGPLTATLLRVGVEMLVHVWAPWLPGAVEPELQPLLNAIRDWLFAPSTWVLLGVASLLMLIALTRVLQRQHRVATPADEVRDAASGDLRRVPAALAAWVIYGLLVLLCALPMLGFAATCLVYAATLESLGAVALLLLAFALGGLLLSVPVAWASVAAGFAPVAASIDDVGPRRAVVSSLRRVRGRWMHAAVAMTVPMLMYVGIASTASSLAMTAAGALAYAVGGWSTLMQGDWLVLSQALSSLVTALALPLASAGLLLTWQDLGLATRPKTVNN